MIINKKTLTMTLNAIETNGLKDMVKDSEFLVTTRNRRTFEYNLNDKAAQAKLVKGAKRDTFEIVVNKTSCNLIFNVGAWHLVVSPSVQYLGHLKEGESCKIDTDEVKVVGVKTGKDTAGKHIDTQVIFFLNRQKVVCHYYNTTQLILVNGHGYEKLIDIFLKPFFESKIAMHEDDIGNYNTLVLETLGSKTVKRSDVKYKGGSNFPCLRCDFAGKTNAALEKHRKKGHALNMVASTSLSSSNSMSQPRHSTRNNSIVELMMDENLTITDISSNINEVNATKADELLKYTCLECNFISKDEASMDVHVKSMHSDLSTTVVDVVCNVCNHKFDDAGNYDAHLETHKEDHIIVPDEALL